MFWLRASQLSSKIVRERGMRKKTNYFTLEWLSESCDRLGARSTSKHPILEGWRTTSDHETDLRSPQISDRAFEPHFLCIKKREKITIETDYNYNLPIKIENVLGASQRRIGGNRLRASQRRIVRERQIENFAYVTPRSDALHNYNTRLKLNE